MKFQELWDQSQAFRHLFLYNGIFRSPNDIDVAKAEALWWDRYPNLEWGFCDVDGCMTPVESRDHCQKHGTADNLPRWKWHKGILYRYMRFDHGQNKRQGGRQYVAYHKHLAKQVFGKVPQGYRVYYSDANPFNLWRGNLILLSRVALAAVQQEVLSVSDAIMLDDVLQDFLADKGKDGRRKQQWSYNLETIARAAGVKPTWVRQEIHRGNLDPGNLDSISEFCSRNRDEHDGTLLKLSKIG